MQLNKSQDAPLVRYQKVSKRFGNHLVLDEISLDIQVGEKVAIIGPSGSGKTTFLRMLMTLEKPSDGTIEVAGEYLWHQVDQGQLMPASEYHMRRVRGNIGMVFQHFNLFPHMSILDNVTLAPIKVLGLSQSEAEERGKAMLEKVGLHEKLAAYPVQLSGGQQQRVAIARALVMRPKVMLFDEVTSALDPELVEEVLGVIQEIAHEGNMAMLIITHEMQFARDIADRVIFFDQGKIVEENDPKTFFGDPKEERTRAFLQRFHNHLSAVSL